MSSLINKLIHINLLPVLLLCVTFHIYVAKAQQIPIKVKIDLMNTAQTIDNIGASGAWFSENIGKYWPEEKKEQLAQWLFSKGFDAKGNPNGIGLSSFRFNIGGGTTEQGDSSGIPDFQRRVECFLKRDGTFDWSKQSGYLWFVRKARDYGVENLIAFSNTPPVYFTQNGLGYKTVKDYHSNLKPDKYGDYTSFLVKVLDHFKQEGLYFKYISPVNEPQWAWQNKYGEGSQEGSPWKNTEIFKVVKSLDSTLSLTHSTTKILITEAGHLEYLYGREDGDATHQSQHFFNAGSPLQLNHLPHLLNVAGGHSYFTDNGDSVRISIRQHVRDTAATYGTHYWQTEYSMLGDGYKEGKKGTLPAIDCALFLAKIIHDDLVYGNAAAWQFWNSWEPSSADSDTRYCLIALTPTDKKFTDGAITATKNLWALGQYSRFIRPGMKRLKLDIKDGLTFEERAKKIMISAFADNNNLVMVLINYDTAAKIVMPEILNGKHIKSYRFYLTDKDHDMSFGGKTSRKKDIQLPPRSIITVVAEKNR